MNFHIAIWRRKRSMREEIYKEVSNEWQGIIVGRGKRRNKIPKTIHKRSFQLVHYGITIWVTETLALSGIKKVTLATN